MKDKANGKIKWVYKKTADLIPYINNARTHSDEQVSQIASSIKEFGFNDPVAIDEDGGIIEGHGRILAAKKLGIEEVPTITLAHLSEAQKKAYIIAHNKLALNAGWDDAVLKAEIEILQGGGNADLVGVIGFSAEELEKIIYNGELDEFPEIDDIDELENHTMTITVSNEDRAVIEDAIKKARHSGAEVSESGNATGKYIAAICREFLK